MTFITSHLDDYGMVYGQVPKLEDSITSKKSSYFLPRNKSLQIKQAQSILWANDRIETIFLRYSANINKESFNTMRKKYPQKINEFATCLECSVTSSIFFLRKIKQDHFPALKKHYT